jgi:hypothetical protein
MGMVVGCRFADAAVRSFDMRRIFVIWIFTFFVTSCGAAVPMAMEQEVEFSSTASVPTATMTATLVPTATVDWQQTAIIAQGTADEARRLNTAATAGYEVRVHEQLKMTAEAERQAFESYSWTATARWTSVPATQTQQAILNTQIAAQQTMMAGQMTAVYEAPTLMVAMANAEVEAQFAPLRFGMEIFALFAIAMFLLFVVGFVIWRWRNASPTAEPLQYEGEGEADLMRRVDMVTRVETVDRSQGLRINRYVVPCRPEALTELAQALVSGEKSFGINSWEGSASENFTREKIKEVRHWMQLNGFAQGIGQGRLHPTDDGMRFFEGWLRQLELPDEFEFERVNGDTPLSALQTSPQMEDHNLGGGEDYKKGDIR